EKGEEMERERNMRKRERKEGKQIPTKQNEHQTKTATLGSHVERDAGGTQEARMGVVDAQQTHQLLSHLPLLVAVVHAGEFAEGRHCGQFVLGLVVICPPFL